MEAERFILLGRPVSIDLGVRAVTYRKRLTLFYRSGVVGIIKIGEAYTAACKRISACPRACDQNDWEGDCIKWHRSLIFFALVNNILDPIWDIIQMSTNIICCCAPIYRSLFNDVHILKSVSHLLKSVRSSFGTSTKGSQNGTSEDWLPLEGSNGSDKMRTEVSAAKRGGTGLFKGRGVEMRHNDGHSDRLDEPLHPLKTTEVKQNVEYV